MTRHGKRAVIDLLGPRRRNGHKITMFLEETGLPYKIFPVNIGKGEASRRVLGDHARQPHSRDGRSCAERRRQADLDLQLRCDAFVSRRETRKIPPPISTAATTRSSGRPGRWRARPDGRAEPSLQKLCGQKSNTPSTATSTRPNRLLASTSASPTANSSPATIGSDIGELSLGRALQEPGPEYRRLPAFEALLKPSAPGPRRSAPLKAKEVNPNFGRPLTAPKRSSGTLFGQTAAVVR